MSGSTPKRVSSIKKDDKAYGNIELVAGDNITIEQEDKKFTINGESADTSGLLKLDQTTPQTIINGIPVLTGLTPTADYQIATKKYIDDLVSGLAGGHDAVTLDANADTILSLSTQELGIDAQTANRIWAGPVSGVAAVPTFRALVADDIPDLSGTYLTAESDPDFAAWLLATPPLYPGGWYDADQNTINLSGFNNDSGFITSFTDEKVKYDAGDATAGYVADKIIAGTGIGVAEGTGANENKLVVSSTITQYTDALAVTAIKADAAWKATDWDTAYGWGNHALAGYVTGTPWTSEGYLTEETDPIFSAWDKSTGISITESQISDFGTYLTDITGESIGDLSDVTLTPTKTLTITESTTLSGGTHSGSNTGDQVIPANEAGSANNFLTAYNNATGAWTKARPTWANIDKTTSNIADLTTKSHTSLSNIGTNTHAQIDTFIGTTVPTDYALKGQTFYIGTTQVAINRASAALTLEGLTLTTPNIGEATGDSITLTTTAATRENIFTASVSDAGNDKFGIGNATTVASRFIPNIYGYVESVDSLQSFGFSGMVKDTNDASSSSTNGIIDFRVMRTDNTTNPEAGTFSAIQNRNLYTFRNSTTVLWTIPAGGHLYSGTDGTGLYDIKTGGNITSGDITTIGDLTVGGVAQATSVDVGNGSTIFGSNDDLTMTVTQHTSAPALNLYPAGGSLTSSRFAFRCVEGTSNFARFQGCTGTTAALASSNTMGIVEFAITQADPNPLKGVINFWTNSGDSIAVKATLNETGVFNAVGGFSDNGSAGIDTTFVDNDGNTITVKGGIITAKVAP